MGHFYKGNYYSTNSKLGPNERFGLENDMSFQELALQIKKENNNISQDSKKISQTDENKEKYDLTTDELTDLLKTYEIQIKNLENENNTLILEKRELIDRNKNLLKLLQEKKSATKENEETCNTTGGKNGDFTAGVFVEAVQGKYGDILKFSINLKKFTQDNMVSSKGYIYFEVKKSQSGKYYASPQKYFNRY